ncbi:hypothetical protein SMB554_19485 (plasmid) [Sinorhizobium meliloti]|nr:hypothetical protein SMB554_19485 [Sinorhizobium meliloti]
MISDGCISAARSTQSAIHRDGIGIIPGDYFTGLDFASTRKGHHTWSCRRGNPAANLLPRRARDIAKRTIS